MNASIRQIPVASANEDQDEEAILAQAEAILRRRCERLTKVSDPQAMGEFLRMRLGALKYEELHAAFLDSRDRVIAVEMLFRGTIDGAEVHPRYVVERSLKHGAAAIVVAHGHPSGDPSPSASDRQLTARLKEALRLMDVRLLDHFVVGAEGWVSMAQRGWV